MYTKKYVSKIFKGKQCIHIKHIYIYVHGGKSDYLKPYTCYVIKMQ